MCFVKKCLYFDPFQKNVITSYTARGYKPRSPLYHYIKNFKENIEEIQFLFEVGINGVETGVLTVWLRISLDVRRRWVVNFTLRMP
jgi:hypothetical protein